MQDKNFEENQLFWDNYASRWTGRFKGYQGRTDKSEEISDYEFLGDEWGSPYDLEEVLITYVYPFLGEHIVAAELGSGGGRVASRVLKRVKRLHCFDISTEMLTEAKRALRGFNNVGFTLLRESTLPLEHTEEFDFVYAFDVFVHLNLHIMWRYLQEMNRVLGSGGKCMIHTSNLASEAGWERFVSQTTQTIQGHFFVTPETVRILARRAGFGLVLESSSDSDNFYLRRDYICVLEKAQMNAG